MASQAPEPDRHDPAARTKLDKETEASKGDGNGSPETQEGEGGRFLCVHCGHRWRDKEKPTRCPSCMRRTGVEALAREGRAENPPWLWPVVALAVFAAAVLGYVYWAQGAASTVGDEVAFEPLSESTLRGHLRRLSVDQEDKLLSFLRPSASVASWAKEHATGSSANEQAASLLRVFEQAQKAGRLVPWSMSRPRGTALLPVDEVLKRVEQGDQENLYPLEQSLVMVTALRAIGVDAMLAEVYALPDLKAPPDPSGDLGYFIVMVGGKQDPSYYDPIRAKAYPELPEDVVRPIDDVNAAGSVLNHLARHELVNEGETEEALKLLEDAVKLDPRSPSIRASRADVLVVTGGAQRALEEYQVAAQLRPDAPRRNNLAAIFMELRQHDRASREVTAALEEAPNYAGAMLTLAALTMAEGDVDEARGHLERASELDPALPQLPLLWAQYYIETHDEDLAVQKADEAIAANPYDLNIAMGAAMVYRVASRYDKMRRQARRILELAPASQRAMYEVILPRRLGPTALENPDDEATAEESAEESGDELPELPSELRLGEDSALLGGGEGLQLGEAGGASLLDGDGEAHANDPMLQLGDPSSYSLGGDFMLQLSE